ncbi:oxidoreductase [Artomyces pyxidatus]|uniref:Oxidoreductase n=1 Tax=Artomyces pyxidatus TaxID=48021 RepID=A0ACB8SYQ4_9AGAM|nr:oxidoreductase [Artomyces pyxidatus]
MFWRARWNPSGKHVYITGGSSGLGLELAKLLSARGAHISIVARDPERLKSALLDIQAVRLSDTQIVQGFSYSLLTAEESAKALDAAIAAFNNETPDAAFLCAGRSMPRFFVEHTEEELRDGMDYGYWVQAWSAWVLARRMVAQRRKGHITFVSSMLGLMTVPGYASYAPAKHALRGLADTLRCEFLLYGIDVHIFFPPTMFTRSYEEEGKTKPALTKRIEEADGGLTPDVAAAALFKGFIRGQTHITADIITDMFRASTRGSAPGHYWVLDSLLDGVAHIAAPIWSMLTDSRVKAHREEHSRYLEDAGLLDEQL